MVDIEDLTEKELDQLHEYFVTLAKMTKNEIDLHKSHSIDAAHKNHQRKSYNTQDEIKK